MQYKCKTIPLTKLMVDAKGISKPLCDSCTTRDCDNPIINHVISILGINEKMKVFSSGVSKGVVVQCEGYTGK